MTTPTPPEPDDTAAASLRARLRASDDPDARRHRIGGVLLAVGLVLLVVLACSPAPYVIRQPGPAFDALHTTPIRDDNGDLQDVEVITIDGAPSYPIDRGELTVMTVNIAGSPDHEPNWFELASAWLTPSKDVLPIEAYYPSGVSKDERDAETSAMMQQSQDTAIAAALTELGKPVGTEVVVAAVNPDGPSAGRLEVGDVLVKYGDQPVSDLASVKATSLEAVPTDITIRRAGVEQVVSITPAPTPTDAGTKPLLGVSVQERHEFPFEVKIQLGDVGGPSAGMIFALSTIDKLTPGDLTGGAIVSGSGTISADGTVGPIGGIRQKLYAAAGIGAAYFIASEANCREALDGGVPGDLTVYAVANLDEALHIVEERAAGVTDGLRTCTDALAANVPQE